MHPSGICSIYEISDKVFIDLDDINETTRRRDDAFRKSMGLYIVAEGVKQRSSTRFRKWEQMLYKVTILACR